MRIAIVLSPVAVTMAVGSLPVGPRGSPGGRLPK